MTLELSPQTHLTINLKHRIGPTDVRTRAHFTDTTGRDTHEQGDRTPPASVCDRAQTVEMISHTQGHARRGCGCAYRPVPNHPSRQQNHVEACTNHRAESPTGRAGPCRALRDQEGRAGFVTNAVTAASMNA